MDSLLEEVVIISAGVTGVLNIIPFIGVLASFRIRRLGFRVRVSIRVDYLM